MPLQDLIRELKSELSRHFEDVVLALMMTPTEYECYELRESMKVLLFLNVLLYEGIVQHSLSCLTGSWYGWRCADWDPLHSNQRGDSCHKARVQTQWASLTTWIACTCNLQMLLSDVLFFLHSPEFGRDIEKDVISETSGHFKRLLVSMLTVRSP